MITEKVHKTFNKIRRMLPLFLLVGMILAASTVFAQEPDPNGEMTITLDPTAAVNFTWVLFATTLVFFMQAGFALVEAGLSRAKNTVNILTKNFMDFAMAALAFWAFGFAIMFGTSAGGFIGTTGFFLVGDYYDVNQLLLWVFQMVFAGAAATIVSGAMAERTKVTSYMAYSFLVTALIYPIFGHWVWGGGWLGELGLVDFAGSGVVHAVGGLVGLASAAAVGARKGKFSPEGKANAIAGHNVPYVVLGTFILFFGWFGFNAGSTLAATDLRISVIAVNTLLAGAVGGVVAIYWSLVRTGKADILLACNGSLAGLVGITAPYAFVAPWAAVVIGAIAALVMITSVSFVENTLKVDDPVGAVSVHGAAGLWGLLAVGIFADGSYWAGRG